MSRGNYGREDQDRIGPTRYTSQYERRKPHFLDAERSIPPRHRYRASQYHDPMYDIVEDEEYEQDGQFDVFDKELLSQPLEIQQRQAVQGRARLSLAPGRPRFFPQSMSQVIAPNDHDIEEEEGPGKFIHGQLGRFAYNANGLQESSSDAQLGLLSSPTFRASQRWGDQITQGEIQPTMNIENAANRRHKSVRNAEIAVPYSWEDQNYMADHIEEYEQWPAVQERSRVKNSIHNRKNPQSQHQQLAPTQALPSIQGIPIVPVMDLPDRLRSIFPYPNFNAVQSKCFESVFRSDDNFVLASPTGSGKTAVLELAICRAVVTNSTDQYKIIYQAPTKALCSERQRDWERKFLHVGLKCAELTGDSDVTDLRNVQMANIIITTPEKWDSMTRRWKDHEKLMRLVKLFLIDEVHILKEDRGAVLEVVVSRTKSIATDVRFIALSATVPNFRDVAAWLGKNAAEPDVPAANAMFGEEFRPVKLVKHVCGYVSNTSNDFAFEKTLDTKLPSIISKYSEGKPIMVFCATRKSTMNTAKLIASWWASTPDRSSFWNPGQKAPIMSNKELRDTVASGVAFHHAGLDQNDRIQVEKSFIAGDISVICCTSTLAVGVNLPCHLVVIKNTVAFTGGRMQEYSDLEMMQMLGRAGRPQFDDSAVAVIMTRQAKVRQYEIMATGKELLESKLHLNLIDHMNAEIGLGTISDLASAIKWLKGTFLYIRLQQNPNHYKLDVIRGGQNLEDQVYDICSREITLLKETNLVKGQEYVSCTEFGHTMARYYVHFATMKIFLGLEAKSMPSEILSAIAQASEYSSIRFRQGEKTLYKLLNQSPQIRWPIPVNLDLPAQKVSLIIQSILGCADISWDGEMGKHRSQYSTDTQVVFKSVSSLIRCIIDCQIELGDSISIHSALLLERSLGSKAWDDSPLQMKQIEEIGTVAVRKLVNAGIRCMEDLEASEPHRIEAIIGRNPPFGLKILEKVGKFPKLRVSLNMQPASARKAPDGVNVQIRADIGFINEKPPQRFGNRPIYVCLLAESSNGRKIHFARISAQKLGSGQSLLFQALMTSHDQSINCYVMCDGIAGSMRDATVKPQISPALFAPPKLDETEVPHQANVSKRRNEATPHFRHRSVASDDFGDEGIDDDALLNVSLGDLEFDHIENYANPTSAITRRNTAKNKSMKLNNAVQSVPSGDSNNCAKGDEWDQPFQLANGKWACNHPCKDKAGCKHLCCKTGLDKPPKKKATSKCTASEKNPNPHMNQQNTTPKGGNTQTKLQLTTTGQKSSRPIEEIDLTQQEKESKKRKASHASNEQADYCDLRQLHKRVGGTKLPQSLHAVMHTKPTYCYSEGSEHNLSFLAKQPNQQLPPDSDYGEISFDDPTPQPVQFNSPVSQNNATQISDGSEYGEHVESLREADEVSQATDNFGEDDSLLGDVMIGVFDSQNLQTKANEDYEVTNATEYDLELDRESDLLSNENFQLDFNTLSHHDSSRHHPEDFVMFDRAPCQELLEKKSKNCFANRDRDSHFISQNTKDVDIDGKDPECIKPGLPKLTPKVDALSSEEQDEVMHEKISEGVDFKPSPVDKKEDSPIPEAFKDLEPWLFREFGDIVELVED